MTATPPMRVTIPAILSFFTILSLKNLAFSGGEDGDPSDIESCEGDNPSDAVKYCEVSDPSDAGAYVVDADSVDDDDDGWYE